MTDNARNEEPQYPEPTTRIETRKRKGWTMTYRVTDTINGNGITSARWELIGMARDEEEEVNIVKKLVEGETI